MKVGSVTALNCNARTTETKLGKDRLKPHQRRDKPQATGNRRLAEQIRKILGKHYASKYRVLDRDRPVICPGAGCLGAVPLETRLLLSSKPEDIRHDPQDD